MRQTVDDFFADAVANEFVFALGRKVREGEDRDGIDFRPACPGSLARRALEQPKARCRHQQDHDNQHDPAVTASEGLFGDVRQIDHDVAGGLITALRVFLQTSRDDLLQFGRTVAARNGRRDGIGSRQHLVHDDAEAENVAPAVDHPPARLLRADVLQGPDEHPRCCIRDGRRLMRVRHIDRFRYAEVEHLGVTAAVDHDVSRLDIAMYDAATMRFIERVGHLAGQADDRVDRHRPAVQTVAQRLSLHILHRDEGCSVIALPRFVNDSHVRMRELRRRDRLAHEPPFRFLVRIGQELQRHIPLQLRILGQIHLPHPAAPDLAEDPVATDGIRDHSILKISRWPVSTWSM